jgi:transposase
LAHEHGLSMRAISERLRLSKTSVATYLWRAREAGLSWPLPPDYASDAALERVLFRRMGRPPRDLSEPDWRYVAQELKRKGMTLTLLCMRELQSAAARLDRRANQGPAYLGGVPKAIVCDNLKAGVAKALWFEPTLNHTFAAMAEHYDTTILPTRSRKPCDKGKVEGAVLIVERWILARLRHRRFFSLPDLNVAIAALLENLNNRPDAPDRKVAAARRGTADPSDDRDLPCSSARRQPCAPFAARGICHRE